MEQHQLKQGTTDRLLQISLIFLSKLKSKVRRFGSDPSIPDLLYGALPCTGGSTYVRLSWHVGPKTRTKIRKHWAIFRVLWCNFVTVARRCRAKGGSVAFEWPRRCSYWKRRNVQRFIREYGLEAVNFDGCAYALGGIQRQLSLQVGPAGEHETIDRRGSTDP